MDPSRPPGKTPAASTHCLSYQVNHLRGCWRMAPRERIESLGVVPGQFAQLLALYEQDGLTQAELCARVQIEQFTMANPLPRRSATGWSTVSPTRPIAGAHRCG